jgi:lysine-N-methylase
VVTDEERRRIEQQNWTAADGIDESQPLFVKEGGLLGRSWYRLNHQPDGGCVFLQEDGLCRIHAKYGEPAKPLACRIYPYVFHPAGSKVTVSLRFSCPSVVRNLGRPVTAQKKELRQIADQVVPSNVREVQPPELTPGRRLEWPDLLRFVDALERTMSADDAPVRTRLQRALFWIGLVEQSKFDNLQGARISEFLDLISQAAVAEVEPAEDPGPPSRVGRMQFRLMAGQYARKDTHATADRSLGGRMRLLRMAWRLTRGNGLLPPLQDCFAEVPFAELEGDFGPLPDETEEIFTRYFLVKIHGLHFCGRAFYNVPLVEGFRSLAMMYPVMLWIARWLALSDGRRTLTTDDLVRAVTIADHNHGYSPALATWSARRRIRNLAQLNDIVKLCAWYDRSETERPQPSPSGGSAVAG